MVPATAFPYRAATGPLYDSGLAVNPMVVLGQMRGAVVPTSARAERPSALNGYRRA